jgi:5,10-methylenetetrahydrofolate reductase
LKVHQEASSQQERSKKEEQSMSTNKPPTSTSSPQASKANNGKLVIPSYIQRKGALGKTDASDKLNKIMNAIDQIYKENASSLSFQVLYT